MHPSSMALRLLAKLASAFEPIGQQLPTNTHQLQIVHTRHLAENVLAKPQVWKFQPT